MNKSDKSRMVRLQAVVRAALPILGCYSSGDVDEHIPDLLGAMEKLHKGDLKREDV